MKDEGVCIYCGAVVDNKFINDFNEGHEDYICDECLDYYFNEFGEEIDDTIN